MGASAAGKVDVTYLDAQHFTDAGRGELEREANLKVLSAHFAALGTRLPDAQTLRIEVLDVDLAGEHDPYRWNDARVMRGKTDWPRLELRWVLLDSGRELRRGQERLSDLGYLSPSTDLRAGRVDLAHEKRLVENWFLERFAPAGSRSP